MNILIDVTDEDIKNGKRGKIDACPIAWATNRLLNRKVLVGYQSIQTIDFGNYMLYKLPQPAQQFITEFDMGFTVLPFSFEAEEVA